MRIVIVAGRWLAAVLGLSLLCIVLALAFFNPNARRDDLQAWVSERTGRSFTLEGELGWQVWPQLAVTLPPMRLGAVVGVPLTGAAQASFAEWQQASASVRLWPLLRGRLEFGAVQLSGLRVRLQRDEAGRNNWQDLLQLFNDDPSPGRFRFAQLAGVQVDDAELTFDDAATGRNITLRIDSLHTSAVAFDRPIKVALNGYAHTRSDAHDGAASSARSEVIDLAFTLAMQVRVDAALQRWQGADVELATRLTATGVLSSETNTALPITLRLQQADWQATQLMLSGLQIAVEDARLTTDQVQLTQLQTTPQVNTAMRIEVPNLRGWLQQLGIKAPATRDATVLQLLSAHLRATGSVQDLRLQVTSLSLDQTRVSGAARWQRTADRTHYTLDLHADQLDLDRYLPVVTTGSAQTTSAPVPVEWLRSLHAQGQLRIDTAQWQGIRARRLTITLDGA